MLTRRQHELLTFIDSYIKRHGYSPNYDEMATAMGFKAKSGVHRVLSALEDRGFIRRFPRLSRGVEIRRPPAARGGSASVTVGNGLVKVLDWKRVAKLAGQHGIRYRTNRALEQFLSDLAGNDAPANLREAARG